MGSAGDSEKAVVGHPVWAENKSNTTNLCYIYICAYVAHGGYILSVVFIL